MDAATNPLSRRGLDPDAWAERWRRPAVLSLRLCRCAPSPGRLSRNGPECRPIVRLPAWYSPGSRRRCSPMQPEHPGAKRLGILHRAFRHADRDEADVTDAQPISSSCRMGRTAAGGRQRKRLGYAASVAWETSIVRAGGMPLYDTDVKAPSPGSRQGRRTSCRKVPETGWRVGLGGRIHDAPGTAAGRPPFVRKPRSARLSPARHDHVEDRPLGIFTRPTASVVWRHGVADRDVGAAPGDQNGGLCGSRGAMDPWHAARSRPRVFAAARHQVGQSSYPFETWTYGGS